MNIVQSIIESLIDKESSLAQALLKTKVLAKRINNAELLSWVERELKGYDREELPDYRIAKANAVCTIEQYGNLFERQPFPISLVNEEFGRKMFMEFPLLEGVEGLEALVNNQNGDTLGKPLGFDFSAAMTRELEKNGANISVQDIVISTHVSNIKQAITEIRSKLLDLMLDLESEYPNLEDISTQPEKNKEEINQKVTVIMKQLNIENKGDGSSINIGDHNQINAASGKNINQNTVDPDTQDSISMVLEELKTALKENQPDVQPDVELEIGRIENQLAKAEPSKDILTQSLETINGFLLSVTANAWTPPIIEGINSLLGYLR